MKITRKQLEKYTNLPADFIKKLFNIKLEKVGLTATISVKNIKFVDNGVKCKNQKKLRECLIGDAGTRYDCGNIGSVGGCGSFF